ncbi:FecR family protein [Neorhizobium alkalisoli]|uniref:FecR family protein n=1 Tax=Neorhizobium alkalisoli TaxID=528178 RepID=UPI001319F3B3|nr:FecR domain-containing protein [Neorhizobium alkalisoli]
MSGGRLVAGGVLIAMLCLAAFFTVPSLMIGWQADYRTSVAETRAVTLEDGSIVHLGAQSAIKTNFEEGRREITLLAGEAFFDVVHDVARPFVVDTRDLKVEVLGTAFDVRLGEDATEVALARGAVRASAFWKDPTKSELLSPGDRLTIDRQSGDISIEKLLPEDIGAWRSGRLFVVNSSIAAAVEEIQRYHPAWITVPDQTLANTRVTGIYDLSDPDKALTALVSPFGGKVRSFAGMGRFVTRF